MKRVMTDDLKEKALKGDKQAQASWLLEEALEFEDAEDNSEEKIKEAVDVIGCLLRFNLTPEDLLNLLSNEKKDYIAAKVVEILVKRPKRLDDYNDLNKRQTARGRKPFNTAQMERVFMSLRDLVKK